MESGGDFVIDQIWRYPVKSLCGEPVPESAVDLRGLLGDRLWAVRDSASGKLGSGKNSRRFQRFPGPPLLSLSSRYPVEPTAADVNAVEPPFVIGADGREYSVLDGSADLLVQRLTGMPTLAVVRESDAGHFDEEPVSAIGTATLRWIREQLPDVATDARRFRPNLVVRTDEPFAEEAWVGRPVRIGTGGDAVEIMFTHVLERCVMTTAAQADLPPAPGMLKMLGARTDQPLRLAVVGAATTAGTIRVGDPITVG
jgi:uncharacterized protein YcbX